MNGVWKKSIIQSLRQAKVKFTLWNNDCSERKYICLKIQTNLPGDTIPDNMKCLNIYTEWGLSRACGINLGIQAASFEEKKMKQNVESSVGLNVTFNVIGLTLPAPKSYEPDSVLFRILIQDNSENLIISNDLSWTSTSKTKLRSIINDRDIISLTGSFKIALTSEICDSSTFLICIQHSFTMDQSPTNDIQCENGQSILSCSNSNFDLEALKVETYDKLIIAGQPRDISLILLVSVPVSSNASAIVMRTSLYLSTDDSLSSDDFSLSYDGFDRGEALAELRKYFGPGDHTINIKGSRLIIPTGTFPKYQGDSYLIAKIDSQNTIEEINEGNNVVASKIALALPNRGECLNNLKYST